MTVKCRMSPLFASEKTLIDSQERRNLMMGTDLNEALDFLRYFCSSLPVLRFSETHDYGRTSFPFFYNEGARFNKFPCHP